MVIGNLSCGCGEEQAPGKSFLVRVSNQSCECIYHAKLMPLLRLHARELVSVEPAAWVWEIESFPYPFQSAGDDALFQLSIGSAVFFFSFILFLLPFWCWEWNPRPCLLDTPSLPLSLQPSASVQCCACWQMPISLPVFLLS